MEVEKEKEKEWEEEEEVVTVSLQRRRTRLLKPSITTAKGNGNESHVLEEEEEEVYDEEEEEKLSNDGDILITKGDDKVVAESQQGEGNGESEKSVYFDGDEGAESADEISGVKFGTAECFIVEKKQGDEESDVVKNFDIQKSLGIVINSLRQENLKDESLSGLPFLPSEKSCESGSTSFKPFDNGIIEQADVRLRTDNKKEVAELDVERVLEEQDTHDLYCPNCNSCITKRVILRKRKRIIRNVLDEAKREKIDTVVPFGLGASPAFAADDRVNDTVDTGLDGSPSAPATNGQDIFRCLSCFSFFIPTGSGFKLFRIFGDRSEDENVQSPGQIPTRNLNWFSSIFASNMRKKTGNNKKQQVEEDAVEAFSPSQILNKSLTEQKNDHVSSIQGVPSPDKSLQVREPVNDAGYAATNSQEDTMQHVEKDSVEALNASHYVNKRLVEQKNDHVSSIQGVPSPGNDRKPHVEDVVEALSPSQFLNESLIEQKNDHVSSIQGVASPGKSLQVREPVNDAGYAATKPREDTVQHVEKDSVEALKASQYLNGRLLEQKINHVSSIQEVPLPGNDTKQHVEEDAVKALSPSQFLNKSLTEQKRDHILLIQGVPSPGISLQVWEPVNDAGYAATKPQEVTVQHVDKDSVEALIASQYLNERLVQQNNDQVSSIQEVPSPANDVTLLIEEQSGTEASGVREWDILKSIIYGGLTEVVTSLGVVSSAAGGDATTLNIIALGLANLFGGLFVIGHKLRELKNDQYEGAANQTNGRFERYQEVLGRRENFPLHATVCVLSYIIFGLLPPVMYGFSFRKSDNREYKLIAVAASSLLCIVLLAIGKAYVRKPPKSYIKTVLYYFSMGLMVSGISYAVGVLIKKLLDELGWWESSAALHFPLSSIFLETRSVEPAWASY